MFSSKSLEAWSRRTVAALDGSTLAYMVIGGFVPSLFSVSKETKDKIKRVLMSFPFNFQSETPSASNGSASKSTRTTEKVTTKSCFLIPFCYVSSCTSICILLFPSESPPFHISAFPLCHPLVSIC